MINKTFVTLKLNEINPYPNNPRINDKAVEKVMESIRECENLDPIEVDENNFVLSGHTRLKALRKLGYEETECIQYIGLQEEQKTKYRILANKTQEFAEWDFEMLRSELDSLEDFDAEFYGFEEMLNELDEPTEITEDEAPENPETRCKLGDIWQLGNHRLICGDSTDVVVIDRLMDGVKADMVFTDPPYGMKKENEGVLNDNLNYDDLLDFNRQWIPLTFGALKDNGSWYCWGIDEPLMDIYSNILKPMARENKITFRNLITWDKGDAGAGGVSFMGKDGLRSYPVGSEKCLFVMCGVQGFNNNADHYDETFEPIRAYMESEAKKVGLNAKQLKEICGVGMYSHWFTKSQFGIIPQEHYEKLRSYYRGQAFNLEYDELRSLFDDETHKTLKDAIMAKRAYFDNTHDKMRDVWDLGRISHEEKMQAGDHATPKPIALCSRAIKSSSREGETVLDVFGGSGSTLIACEQLNRKCYMAELDPHYCDVIIERWENLTGGEAVLVHES